MPRQGRGSVGRGLIVVALVAGSAHAAPCADGAEWTVLAGSLARGAHCSEHVLTTEPSPSGDSRARVLFAEHVSGDVDLALRWQPLDANPVTLEIEVPGGFVLVKRDAIGLYVDEARWAEHGFTRLSAPRPRGAAMALQLLLRDRELHAVLDGKPVAMWTLPARPVEAPVVLGVIGPRAHRTRVLVSAVTAAHTRR